ncbi:S53 family peptidase [Actinoplanes sp. NPDC026623]|uniref:S53 family peptidase n=1 Tax=Actinoplanes sp. NPDC026623 TaxID=3155610 RepID=UPI00340109A4
MTPKAGLVTFYLRLPYHSARLMRAATRANTPGPGYRHFLSAAQAGRQFGATDKDIARVSAAVTTLGLSFAADPSRLFARVYGTAMQWQEALGVPLGRKPGSTDNPFLTYALPRRVPAGLWPAGTSILVPSSGVYDAGSDGLRPPPANTPDEMMPDEVTPDEMMPFEVMPDEMMPDEVTPDGQPWPHNTGVPLTASCRNRRLSSRQVYTPSQVQRAYGVSTLKTQAKGTPIITVIDLGGGWSARDIDLAAGCWGYTAPTVAQSQGDGVPTPIANVDAETSMDLQTVAAVAPAARLRLVQSTNSDSALLDAFSRALADPDGLPDAVTVSYGGCAVFEEEATPSYLRAVDAVLAMAALTGVSTLIAAGDSGSTTCGTRAHATTMSYPAVSPFVTAVGGTRLTLGRGNTRTDEVVWNDSGYGKKAAGGGGTSRVVSRPWYQPAAGGPTRTVPDVAALAAISPGWPVVINGALYTVGGTSGAAPFTAAALALVSATERSAGRPPVGLANGWFYSVANQPGIFYDVTAGTNDLETVGCCQAGPGYDRASGLGVPNWAELPATLPGKG